MLETEQTDRVCEKCGKEISNVAERGDDYSSYCSRCYKKMIEDRWRRDDERYD